MSYTTAKTNATEPNFTKKKKLHFKLVINPQMVCKQIPPKIPIEIAPDSVDVVPPLVIKLYKIFAGYDAKVSDISKGRKNVGKSQRGWIEYFLTVVDLFDDFGPVFFRK